MNKNHLKYIGLTTAFITMVLAFIVVLYTQYGSTSAAENKAGSVNASCVNIRTSAGVNGNANRLTLSGVYVQLNSGDKVTIVGQETANDGSLWYKITFTYSNTSLTGYIKSDYVNVQEEYIYDASFESYLTSQGFPESYKDGLRALHAKYPNWVFQADIIDYTFTEVVDNEALLGRSLVPATAITSWKSTDTGAYNWSTGVYSTFDGNSWVAASKDVLAYTLDPRNFLNESNVFMFESLTYDTSLHTVDKVQKMLEKTFMSGTESGSNKTYANIFMDAAKQSGTSPFHLVSRVIQEVGSAGTTGGVTGYYAPSTGNVYTNLYNFYNIGAYSAQGRGAIENGLIYASKTDSSNLRPWNTKYKAIVGGAIYIGKGFINVGQDTIYYEKFDLVGTPYSHQYMTNILAPRTESVRMSNAYTDDMKKNTALIFKIPVYKNMTAAACKCPQDNSAPSKTKKKESGTYTYQINANSYEITGGIKTDYVEPTTKLADYTIVGNYIKNVQPLTTTDTIIKKCSEAGLNVSIVDASGNKATGIVGTGFKIINEDKEYTVLIYGDVNGDGKITVMDMVYQQRHILGVEKLTGVYLKAADACRSTGNGTVELLDMVYVKRHILEILTISQE